MDANSRAWKRYFDATSTLYEIETQGYSIVQATVLKQLAEREPRLLAKLDTLKSLPQIFRQHSLSILPIQNGRYILFKDDEYRGFFRFSEEHFDIPTEEYNSNIDLFQFDAFPGNGVLNESQALDFAYISSLLSKFTEDRDLNLVIRGRQFTAGFEFLISDRLPPISVEKVQIEVDAGYESPTSIYLVEAKIGKRSDFNIRQLFYPYLEWQQRTRKTVRPIFLTYTNGKYYLTEFRFEDVYGSLEIVNNRCFMVNESPTPEISISEYLHYTDEMPEPAIPYPQADDLDKVVDLVKLSTEGFNTHQLIADYFDFDMRQAQYYGNAALYLDLLEKHGSEYVLSDFGERFFSTRSNGERTRMLIEKLVQRPTFRQAMQLWSEQNYAIYADLRSQIAELLHATQGLSEITARRRSSTVIGWLRWFSKNSKLRP